MNDERREIARRVMRAMRHKSARRPLASPGPDGSASLVICLREDTIGYAADRVHRAGGIATVVVPHDNGLVPLCWEMGPSDERLIEGNPTMHPDSTLGMLVDYLTVRELQEHLVFRISLGESEASITEGGELTVPA